MPTMSDIESSRARDGSAARNLARRGFGAALLILSGAFFSACAILPGAATPTAVVPTVTLAPPTQTPPPLAAIVNGEYITLAEFEVEFAQHVAALEAAGTPVVEAEATELVLEDLVNQVLLSQGARESGYVLSSEELENRQAELSSQLGGAYLEWIANHGYTTGTFQAALKRSVEAAWMRDKIIAGVASTVEQVHVRQILAYNEIDARQVLERLQSGEDFDELAAQSDPVTRGELGWVSPGYLLDEAANQAVFALQAGEYSDVVTTIAGFHIFKVVERTTRPLAPDALLGAQEKALSAWLSEQMELADIVRILK